MNFKKILIFTIAIIIFVFACKYISTHIYSLQGNKIISVKIKDQIFHAEVVSSSEKMQKGLGGRSGICQTCGMLFEFPQEGRYGFWMKGMQFPLDIIWIKDKKIVHIEKNVPKGHSLTLVSNENADTVLEINAGTVDRLGLEVGDEIDY